MATQTPGGFVRLGLVILGLAVAGGHFAPLPAAENYAFLVGVQTYTRPDLKPLKFSDNDITQLGRTLVRGGFNPDRMMTLSQSLAARDVRHTPFRENILLELKLFVTQIQEDDTLVVGLAGHGVQFAGSDEVYFCPGDADIARTETLISINSLYDQLRKDCKAKNVVLLVDACRNDPLTNLARSRQVVELQSVTRPQNVTVPRGLVVVYSCSAGEQAFEHPTLRHGVFFHHVIQGLGGKADTNKDREVTLDELHFFAASGVQNFAIRELRATQTPQLKGEITAAIPLAKIPGEPVPPPNPVGKPDLPAAEPVQPGTTPVPNGVPPKTEPVSTTAPGTPAPGTPTKVPGTQGPSVGSVPTPAGIPGSRNAAPPKGVPGNPPGSPLGKPAPPRVPVHFINAGTVPMATLHVPDPGRLLAYTNNLEDFFGADGANILRYPVSALVEYLDPKHPGAVFLDSDGESAVPFVSGIFRAADPGKFREFLQPYPTIPDAPVHRLTLTDKTVVFVREADGWLFFSVGQVSDVVLNPPADPTEHLADAVTGKDISAQVYLQNIPAAASETVATIVRAAVRQRLLGTVYAAANDPELDKSVNEIADLFQRQAGQVTVQVETNPKAGTISHHFQLRPLPHSKLAGLVEEARKPKPAPNAPACVHHLKASGLHQCFQGY